MNRASLLITLLMGVLTIVLWALVNRPGIEPPWPAKIDGFSFSPMRGEQSPLSGTQPSIGEIDADLALLAGDAHSVRTYTVRGNLAEVPRLAKAHNLNVALGAWLDKRAEANREELDALIRIFQENHEQIVRVIVGNETILREDQTVAQMIGHLRQGAAFFASAVNTTAARSFNRGMRSVYFGLAEIGRASCSERV